MKRLVNSPKYTINSSSSSSYKATIMMLMDCETQPFSTYTKLTNLQDLYRNYYTESNNISYNIAKNLLKTNKLNIIGINHTNNENIRPTIAVYKNNDGNPVSIYPSYTTISSSIIEQPYKKYTIYLNDLYSNGYFKIYISKDINYLVQVVNLDTLSDFNYSLYESKLINNQKELIKRISNITDEKYQIPIVIGISKSDNYDNIIDKFNKELLKYDIKYDIGYSEITIYSEYINEPILTSYKYKFVYDSKINSFINNNISIDDNYRKWYAYQFRISDRTKHHYFKTYFTKQNSYLVCIINTDNLSKSNMVKIQSSIKADRNEVISQIFNINRNDYTNSFIILVNDRLSEIEYRDTIIENLRNIGLFNTYEIDIDQETNVLTRYLTVYSNTLCKTPISNMDLVSNERISYDIDYLSNYNSMVFSAYTRISSSIPFITLQINRYGDRYDIQVKNIQNNDLLDIESYSDTNIDNLLFDINQNSKYIHMDIHNSNLELPTGIFTLDVKNVNSVKYDYNYLETLSNITKEFIQDLNIDFLYNTKNSLKFLNAFNQLSKKSEKRCITISDAIEEPKLVDRFDLSDIQCSKEILANVNDEYLLKDDKYYRKCYIVLRDIIFVYNNYKIPDEFLLLQCIKIKPKDIYNPEIKFSELVKIITTKYNELMRSKLFDYINDIILESSIKIGDTETDQHLKDIYSFDETQNKNNDDIIGRFNVNGIKFNISSYLDMLDRLSLDGYPTVSYQTTIPKWIKNEQLVKNTQIYQICGTKLSKEYNNILLFKHSMTSDSFDTSYQFINRVFTNNEYEFDIQQKLTNYPLDNYTDYLNELHLIYGSTEKTKCIQLNDLYDNEYYYSLLNPSVTYNNYMVPAKECFPAIMQINHVINELNSNSIYLTSKSQCQQYIDKAINDVSYIIPIINKLELLDYTRDNHYVTISLRITFEYTTKLTYDFNVTINI